MSATFQALTIIRRESGLFLSCSITWLIWSILPPPGVGQERGVVEGRPGGQQFLGMLHFAVERIALKTSTREHDDQFLKLHISK